MYMATFTFAKRAFDDEFHALDTVIAQIARATPGCLGEESWQNPTNGLLSYWQTLESLQALMKHPAHIDAKHRQRQWLAGYQVVIAQVVGSYGDGDISHPLAGMTLHATGGAGPNP